jgi:hypothetical protein
MHLLELCEFLTPTQLVADAIIELSINPAKAKNVLYYWYI